MPRAFAPAFALLVALVVSGCDYFNRPAVCDDCNVVFILADTLRADRLGAYGYERETSPFFDQLVESGVLFEQARSQAPCTFPSVNSMLTSRYVDDFLDKETRPGIPDSIPSLPEILKRHGYTSAAVSASPIVRKNPGKHNPKGGFGQGFEVFDELCEWNHSECVTIRAAHTLDRLKLQKKSPFFLYLHFMDPHDPYRSKRTFNGLFSEPYEGPHEFVAQGDPNPLSTMIREGTFEQEVDVERDIGHLQNLYDEGVRSFDEGLKEVFAMLEARELLDNTLIVLTSDHGEAFYEHGRMKHCQQLYDTEIRVPLWFRNPAMSTTGRVQVSTPLIDITPTLLDLLGLPLEPQFEGSTLRPWLENPSLDAPNLSFSSYATQRAVAAGRFKLIRSVTQKGSDQLFDVENDPGETENIRSSERRELHHLTEVLEDWIQSTEEGDAQKKEDLAKEIEEELRSLGYIG